MNDIKGQEIEKGDQVYYPHGDFLMLGKVTDVFYDCSLKVNFCEVDNKLEFQSNQVIKS